ncbi:hypothetical protein ABH926_005325 [Catenulispora sp. GP43]
MKAAAISPQGLCAVGRIWQVVERAEHQDRVGAGFWGLQRSGVAGLDGERGVFGGLLAVACDGVDEGDGVAERGQPCRVDARSSADVQDVCGRRWQRGRQQFLGAFLLQPSERGDVQAVGFGVVLVVEGGDVRVQIRGLSGVHPWIIRARRRRWPRDFHRRGLPHRPDVC